MFYFCAASAFLAVGRCTAGGAAHWGSGGGARFALGLDCQIQAKNGETRLVTFNLFGCRVKFKPRDSSLRRLRRLVQNDTDYPGFVC